MIDKVMIDGQQVELTKDMFEMAPANFGDNEAISRPSLTFWQDARKRLFKNPGAVTGLVILCCIILMAIFAPMFSKFDYKTQNIRHTKVPPKMPIVSSLGIMDGKNSDGVDVYEEKGIDVTQKIDSESIDFLYNFKYDPSAEVEMKPLDEYDDEIDELDLDLDLDPEYEDFDFSLESFGKRNK